jgi:protein phosphatase
LKTFALTHIGLIRKRNEDRYLVRKINDGFRLLAVADGMGGEASGDYAAEIVIKKLSSVKFDPKEKKRQLLQLVKEADRAIIDEVKKNAALEGMGSTLTCGLFHDGILHWVHVGDSRLYVTRNGQLIQITKDQNMAQFLLDEGEITDEEARHHPSQNQLDQCIGCGNCKPEIGQVEIKVGDLLILTTDGLHTEIAYETFSSILLSPIDIEMKAKSLIKAGLSAGGTDNMTIVVARM